MARSRKRADTARLGALGIGLAILAGCGTAPPLTASGDKDGAPEKTAPRSDQRDEEARERTLREHERRSEQAEAMLEEGREAFARWEKGRQLRDLEAAHGIFRECVAQFNTQACVANLAWVAFRLERYPEAAFHAASAVFRLEGGFVMFPMPHKSEEEKRLHEERLEAMRKLLADARTRVGAVILECPARTEIFVDGVLVARCPLSADRFAEIFVEPNGPRRIEARHPNRASHEVIVELAAGATQTIDPWAKKVVPAAR